VLLGKALFTRPFIEERNGFWLWRIGSAVTGRLPAV
jgi:hypothetical protein